MERHHFDLVSFVFGAIFVAIAAAHLFTDAGLRGIDGRWILPTALVLIGIVLLGAAVTRSMAGRSQELPPPAESDAPETSD